MFSKGKIHNRPISKGNRINYYNFNDYIDIKFSGMNPNSRFYNSYKKSDMPAYFTKLYTNDKVVQENPKVSDLLKITNLKVDNRNVKSAKVKFKN
jgi:hypothetical protein